jgi:hypothetical protein
VSVRPEAIRYRIMHSLQDMNTLWLHVGQIVSVRPEAIRYRIMRSLQDMNTLWLHVGQIVLVHPHFSRTDNGCSWSLYLDLTSNNRGKR